MTQWETVRLVKMDLERRSDKYMQRRGELLSNAVSNTGHRGKRFLMRCGFLLCLLRHFDV